MDNKETQSERLKEESRKATEAYIYMSQPFSFPLSSKLSNYLNWLQSCEPGTKNVIRMKFLSALIERFYEFVNKKELGFQEQILLLFMQTISAYAKGFPLNSEIDQLLVVGIWTGVTLAKKCKPEKNHKECIRGVLKMMSGLVREEKQFCKKIYPQVSNLLMLYAAQYDQIQDIVIFRISLQLLAKLIIIILSQNPQEPKFSGIRTLLQQSDKNLTKQQTFLKECLLRFQNYLKLLANKVNAKLEINYQRQISNFLQKIIAIPKHNINLIGAFGVILAITEDNESEGLMKKLLLSSDQGQQKIIKNHLNHEFFRRLESQFETRFMSGETYMDKNSQILKLARLAPNLDISLIPDQLEFLFKNLVNKILKCEGRKMNGIQEVIPQTHISSLPCLQKNHSFSSFLISVSTLLNNLNEDLDRILVERIYFCDLSLKNVKMLKKMVTNLPFNVKIGLLEKFVEAFMNESNKQNEIYKIDMDINKFWDFFTKILIIYWIISSMQDLEGQENIVNLLFELLTKCQAVRILSPSFTEQYIVVALILLICYKCYTQMLSESQDNASLTFKMKKIKLKLTVLEVTLNNDLSQSSHLILRQAVYYILLKESAPKTINEMFENLQTTLINRNSKNLIFIRGLIKYCTLSNPQTENLALRLCRSRDGQNKEKVLKQLLPALSTETIRKCILQADNGKWIQILSGNVHLLYMRKLTEKKQQKIENFYMNDGENVQATNALGVILLQLGNQWEFLLKSSSKEKVLDLFIEIFEKLNKNGMVSCFTMVFFKFRFISILKILFTLLDQSKQIINENIMRKISILIDQIPSESFQRYYTSESFKKSGEQILEEKDLNEFLKNIQQWHKRIKKRYFNDCSEKNQQDYELSERNTKKIQSIIEGLENRIQ